MFEESPLYYFLISLIFLLVFGAIGFSTWLVWLTPIAFIAKLAMTAIGFFLAVIIVVLYTVSVD